MDVLHEILFPAVNAVFLGEAGCGKSEIAMELALRLAALGDKPVHFFDLDMTKPLFRSRDAGHLLESAGVQVHFEQQFMDAPTLAGGIRTLLKDNNSYTVLDLGGDDIGARSVGGLAPLLNRGETAVYYVINPYRPWSMDAAHIRGGLARILGVSHVQPEKLRFVGNPNLGAHTEAADVRAGAALLQKTVGALAPVRFFCAKEELCGALPPDIPALPLRPRLTYEWEEAAALTV